MIFCFVFYYFYSLFCVSYSYYLLSTTIFCDSHFYSHSCHLLPFLCLLLLPVHFLLRFPPSGTWSGSAFDFSFVFPLDSPFSILHAPFFVLCSRFLVHSQLPFSPFRLPHPPPVSFLPAVWQFPLKSALHKQLNTQKRFARRAASETDNKWAGEPGGDWAEGLGGKLDGRPGVGSTNNVAKTNGRQTPG